MQDRPSFVELLDAVRHFLETEVAPRQTDHRARFRTLVTINALTILDREFRQDADIVRTKRSGSCSCSTSKWTCPCIQISSAPLCSSSMRSLRPESAAVTRHLTCSSTYATSAQRSWRSQARST
jgi:hypothetical protein